MMRAPDDALIEPPIVCAYAEDRTVRVYPTVAAAAAAVEGIDIRPEDRAYDRRGRRLAFEVIPDGNTGRVRLHTMEAGPSHLAEMEAHLRAFARLCAEINKDARLAAWAESASLEDMIQEGLRIEMLHHRSARRAFLGCLAVLLAGLALLVWLARR